MSASTFGRNLEHENVNMRPAIPSSRRRESALFSSDFGIKLERTHPATRDCYDDAAFTIIELLVVLATMAVLAALLLPALAGTQSQSKVTACKARFRQWAASANLYANDNRGWLPTGNPYGGGAFAWDVGTNLLNALYPYGMDVPDYFCPMRPNEWDAVNRWVQADQPPLSFLNINELIRYFSRSYVGECQINDNYWVQRYNGNPAQGATLFPIDWTKQLPARWPSWIKNGMPTCALYGWPQRLHDIAAPYVPFVSDSAGSGNSGGLYSPVVGTAVTNISPDTAHFVNGTLLGVNLAFADGHVASHTPDQMRCVYASGGSGPYWFY